MKFNEAINDGLHAIASGIKDNAKQLEIDREKREYDLLKGWMTDEEKLRMLKYDLYSATRANARPEYVAELRETISLLSNEVERKTDRENSLPCQLNELAKAVIGLIALATVGSYTVQWSGACQHINSKFCNHTRIIPYGLERYFADQPVLVNPERFNVNIDQSN